MKIAFTILLVLLLLCGIMACNDKSTANNTSVTTPAVPVINGKEFVTNLEKLGYFKYANPKDLDSLKANMIDMYDPTNELVTIWDDKTLTPKDYRLYWCDSEALFEAGGFMQMLDQLQPTFHKIRLELTVARHIEEWNSKNNWLNHSVTINGTNYTIFKNFSGTGWGEAVQTFADILNNELRLQNKEERIYLIHGGNDGRIIFLSPTQFNYIDSIYSNNEWKPLKVNDWCSEMDVRPQKI